MKGSDWLILAALGVAVYYLAKGATAPQTTGLQVTPQSAGSGVTQAPAGRVSGQAGGLTSAPAPVIPGGPAASMYKNVVATTDLEDGYGLEPDVVGFSRIEPLA
jgi:hypothetical protein